MTIASLLIDTCTVTRRNETGTKDALGHDTGDYTYASHLTGVACRVESVSFEDLLVLRETVDATHRIFFLPGIDVKHTDRVTHGGKEYEITHVDPRPGGVTDSHIEAYALERQ